MPIPSWEELNELAREVSESKRDEKVPTEELIARGLSDFASKLLTAGTPTQRFTGSLTEEGIEPIDVYRGGSLAERMGRFAGGYREDKNVTKGIPLTQDQTSDFAIKSALERQKQTGRMDLQGLRNKARMAGGRVNASSQPLNKDVSDYIYGSIDIDPSGKRVLTFGEANILLRGKGLDTSEFFRDLGIDIQLGKDFLGEVSAETKATVAEKRGGRGNPFKPKVDTTGLNEKAKKWLSERGQQTTEANIQAVIKARKVK